MDFGFDRSGGSSASSSASSNANDNGGKVTDLSGDINNLDKDGNPITHLNDPTKGGTNGQQAAAPAAASQGGQNGQTAGDKPAPTDAPKLDQFGNPIVNANTKDDKNGQQGKTGDDNGLVEGAVIELGTDAYTVDKDGNLLAKDGSIFKEAKDVSEWLKEFEIEEPAGKDISIETIQKTIGIEIVDDQDKPVVFENTPDGIKAYVDAVSEVTRDEHYEEARNTLFQRFPFVPDIINYYVANGNSLEGFGEVQDRSNITIDDSNEAQQESIIRTAWKEQNRTGDQDNYIAYLKSQGILAATAKTELEGLKQSDKATREALAAEAEDAENAHIEKLANYWGGVKSVIDSKTIAGYQIPDTIIINKNGQKISATPNDFYNYMYRVDNTGKSQYQNELAQTTPESRRDDEILRAFLRFTGGSYSNLVNMAVNKANVIKLKADSQKRTTSSIRITKPEPKANTGSNIDVGYK